MNNHEYYLKNREKIIARAKDWLKKHNWKTKQDPQHVKARYAIRNELKAGRIIKAFCQICSSTNNLQFHHKDYTKPLDVLILCRECHLKLHNKSVEDLKTTTSERGVS